MPYETGGGQGRKTHTAGSPLCIESSPATPRQSFRAIAEVFGEGRTSKSCVGSVTPVGVFVPYPSRTSANRITLKMYPMSTDRMAAGRQPAEHLKHVEPDISEVML
jgi:hypothetical protein